MADSVAARPPASTAERLGSVLLDWMLPGPCASCDRSVMTIRPRLGLCRHCLQDWPVRETNRCSLCGRTIHRVRSTHSRCGECSRRRVSFQHLTVGWDYEEPVAGSLRALKFQRLDCLAGHLTDRLLEDLGSTERELLTDVDGVTAVPLWWRRRLTRGYNQSALLARTLAHGLGLPCYSLLVRRRGSVPQSRLVRAQRRRNVRGTMRARRRASLPSRLLLIDDVITTGATLEEASSTLRRAGVSEIRALAFARTPDPSEP